MTIIATDLRILAADSLCTAGDVKVYHRSKIRIIKQHALAACGDENDGFRFEKWFLDKSGEEFICEDNFAVIIMSRAMTMEGYTSDESFKLNKLRKSTTKVAIGAMQASAAAEILMRISKLNAHQAAIAAANYQIHCGLPVYSITKKQLEYIHPDFAGYWIGTYQTPITKVDDFLITEKQWLKT